MKKILLSILMITSVTSIVNAQSAKYLPAMEKNLLLFDSSKTAEQLLTLSGNFERIANAEKTQWLPYYYAGLSLILSALQDPKADKDALAAKALDFATKADAIQKSDETAAVYYLAYIAQLMVDPMTRYQDYGVKAQAALDAGLKLNPNNPRLYYLKGAGLLQTPEFVGGGKDAAKSVLEKAVALYATDKPQPMYPNWGKEKAIEDLNKCK